MSKPTTQPYAGPAVFSHGFRPFFLVAGIFAGFVMPLWMLVWLGKVAIGGPFSPLDWHIHELLFGYTSAVIAGFLFTAIPNWTGRMPTRGWPLAVLTSLWVVGRVAVAGGFGLGSAAVMLLDCAFMAAIGVMVTREIVSGRNWSNLKVLAPVIGYLGANLIFHLEAMSQGSAEHGRRLGFAMVIMLILLIGGRIIPSFTRNRLVKQSAKPGALPVPFGLFDAFSLGTTLVVLLLWAGWPTSPLTGSLLTLAGAGQVFRMMRWRGWRVWSDPLVLMLHVAFCFVSAGIVALGLASVEVLSAATGYHLVGIGGIGCMTLAVMMRASLGHTGRALNAGLTLTLAFSSVVLAAVVRVSVAQPTGLWIAAVLWTIGFGIFVVRFVPVLIQPNPARRKPNGP